MDIKEEISKIIKDERFAFSTQTIINEFTTKKIKASRNVITKTLRELGYEFDKHSKFWKKKQIEKPQYGIVFIPEIHFALIDKNSRQVLEKKTYVLGVFFDRDRANTFANTMQEQFNYKANEIANKNPNIEPLINCLVNQTIGNMIGEDLIFQIN